MSPGGHDDRTGQNLPDLPAHWLNLLLENISDIVMVTDREGTIRFWNRGAEITLQHAAGDVLGKNINLIYVPTEGEEFQEAWSLAFEGEIISDVEVVEKRKDGRERTVLLSLVPILGDTGEVEYLAGIGKDITILRGLEERVLASEKLETVREMIITLNHKMNQPLAVVSVYLGLLQDKVQQPSPEELREYLGEIEKQIDRISRLVKKVGEMEKVESVPYLRENKMVDVEEDEQEA